MLIDYGTQLDKMTLKFKEKKSRLGNSYLIARYARPYSTPMIVGKITGIATSSSSSILTKSIFHRLPLFYMKNYNFR